MGRPYQLLLEAAEPHLVGGQDRAVVMFEDLQWADAESLALFGRLATTAGLPVLLIGSYRPGRAGPSSGRAAGVRAGVRNPRRPQAVAAGLVARARRGAGRLARRAGRGGEPARGRAGPVGCRAVGAGAQRLVPRPACERARGAGPDRRTRAAGPPLLAGRAPGPLPPRPLMAVAPGRGPARGGGRVRAGARRLRGRAGRPGPAPLVADAQLGLARCRLALGDAETARSHAQAAVDRLARWPGWRKAEAETLLRRLGGGPAVDGPQVLTPREREVAVLVAEGLSNGEIGRRLFVSAKTASVHVSNILGKLGMSSRAEIAAWAVRQGLRPV